ncbi:hypothetical protein GUJ93_ZPchr0073g2815 [Zizania palustris]|uniref:Uncharacterized protein n=1 Tax=Zizania palustris TaxID=103762 RepID=A0A8J5R2S8_ZIZPA|nr:hypothetical protein GUJ93_ZPchr0073g2815 [Zizania palustris]
MVIVKTNSQVVVGHVDKCFQVRHPNLAAYLEAVRKT